MTSHTAPNALDAAALALGITHRVVTTYSDGETLTQPVRSEIAAEKLAVGERSKIGRYFDRRAFPNRRVRVVSVEITKIEG